MASKYERSSDYRKKYLKKHKGFFGIYVCSYCGKLCTKSQMEVDHIYPVNGAKTNKLGKFWVNANTWYLPSNNKGVNEPWNTTSACHNCNSSKSDTAGSWVVRGYLGRVIFPILNIILILGLAYGIIQSALTNEDSNMKLWLFLNVGFRIISFFIRGREFKIPDKFSFTNIRRWKK